MKKFNLFAVAALAMFLFIFNVSASSIPLTVYSLTYRGTNILDNNNHYYPSGNSNINFSIIIDSENWTKMSLVLCMDGSHSGGIIPSEYSSFIRNINHVATDYHCKYSNSNYDGGRVHAINFEILPQGEFTGNFTVYNATVSLELIDFLADSSNFVNLSNYANETLINQNSQIINGQNNIYNQQVETNNKLNGVNDKLNDTNNKLNDVNNSLNNDNIDTSGANSFFSGFTDTDHGGISAVVTAPLNLIKSMTNTCQPLYMDVLGADVELPCGDTLFWGREDVKTFRNTWNVLVGGVVIYALMLKLFQVIQNLKDPESDKVEVMKL